MKKDYNRCCHSLLRIEEVPFLFVFVCRPSALSNINFKHIVDLVGFWFEPGGQERFNVKGVLIVRIGGVLEIGVPGDVIFIRQKRTDAPQLEDTFSTVHNRKLILAHQFFATLSSGEFNFY